MDIITKKIDIVTYSPLKVTHTFNHKGHKQREDESLHFLSALERRTLLQVKRVVYRRIKQGFENGRIHVSLTWSNIYFTIVAFIVISA